MTHNARQQPQIEQQLSLTRKREGGGMASPGNGNPLVKDPDSPFARQGMFRSVFDEAPVGLAVVSSDGRLMCVNRVFRDIFDDNEDLFSRKSIRDAIHPQDYERDLECRRKLISGECRSYELEVRNHPDDECRKAFQLKVSLLGQPDQKKVQFVYQVQETTYEEAETEESRRIASSVNRIDESVVMGDIDGTITFANESFLCLSGFTRAEAIGARWHDLIGIRMDGLSSNEWWSMVTRAEKWSGVVSTFRKGGVLGKEEVNISFNRNSLGRPINFIAVSRDVSEKWSNNMRIMQTQRLESIGLLTGGIAHDFNNILHVMFGFIKYAKEGLSPKEQRYRDLNRVQESAERAADLTRQLLAFSQQQIIETKQVDLNEVIARFLQMIDRIVGNEIHIDFRPGLGLNLVKLDPGQFAQVLLNLCDNARDAMPRGGTIVLETANDRLDEAFCSKRPWMSPGEYIRFTVKDTGCGMDEKTLSKIFDPFYTTKCAAKGTGLGLSTVYGIVKQHSGFIDAESTPGHGTTFTVFFPVTEVTKGSKLPPRKGKVSLTPGLTSETAKGEQLEEAVRSAAVEILGITARSDSSKQD